MGNEIMLTYMYIADWPDSGKHGDGESIVEENTPIPQNPHDNKRELCA